MIKTELANQVTHPSQLACQLIIIEKDKKKRYFYSSDVQSGEAGEAVYHLTILERKKM